MEEVLFIVAAFMGNMGYTGDTRSAYGYAYTELCSMEFSIYLHIFVCPCMSRYSIYLYIFLYVAIRVLYRGCGKGYMARGFAVSGSRCSRFSAKPLRATE